MFNAPKIWACVLARSSAPKIPARACIPLNIFSIYVNSETVILTYSFWVKRGVLCMWWSTSGSLFWRKHGTTRRSKSWSGCENESILKLLLWKYSEIHDSKKWARARAARPTQKRAKFSRVALPRACVKNRAHARATARDHVLSIYIKSWYFHLRVKLCVKISHKFKVPKLKIWFHGFVGNVNADLGLPWFCYWARFGFSRANFRSKKMNFLIEW